MLQAWNQQLGVDSASDKRIQRFVDLRVLNAENTPELGATCENPDFAASPVPMDTSGAPAGTGGIAPPLGTGPSDGAPATP